MFSKANKSRFFYSVVALGRFRCLSSPLETLTPTFLKLSVTFLLLLSLSFYYSQSVPCFVEDEEKVYKG